MNGLMMVCPIKCYNNVYSQQAVELVVSAIKQDPDHAVDMIIEKNKAGSRPQEQGNSRFD